MNVLEKILEEIKEINYYPEGMGCGIEDCGITDRYEACEYGWNKAIEAVVEVINNIDGGKDINVHSNDSWIPVEKRLPEPGTLCYVTCEDGSDWLALYAIGGSWIVAVNSRPIAWYPLPTPYKGE